MRLQGEWRQTRTGLMIDDTAFRVRRYIASKLSDSRQAGELSDRGGTAPETDCHRGSYAYFRNLSFSCLPPGHNLFNQFPVFNGVDIDGCFRKGQDNGSRFKSESKRYPCQGLIEGQPPEQKT